MNSRASIVAAYTRAFLGCVAILGVWFPWFVKRAAFVMQKPFSPISLDIFIVAPYLALAVITWEVVATISERRKSAWAKNTLWSLAVAPIVYAAIATIVSLCFMLWFLKRSGRSLTPLQSMFYGQLITGVFAYYFAMPLAVPLAAIGDAATVSFFRRRHDFPAFIMSDSFCVFLLIALAIRLVPVFPADIRQPGPGPSSIRSPAQPTELEKMRELVRTQSDVNKLVGDEALLTIAVKYSDAETARLLVDRGAVDTEGKALLLAAQHDDANLVQLALKAKAPIDARDQDGMSALMLATAGGFVDRRLATVDALIKAGANVNAVDKRGRTALDYAVMDKVIADRLRLAGAQPGGQPRLRPPNK